MFKKLAVYVFVPAAICGLLMAMYFSGVEWLQRLVSPAMPGMHRGMGREFGLLENLQNVYLLAIIVICAVALKRKTWKPERIAWVALLAVTVFVLLEEIDYGLHYYEYAMGIERMDAAQIRNLHNQGDATDMMKLAVDVGTGVLFVVMPLAFVRSQKPLVRYVTPSLWYLLTVLVMVGTSKLAHGLNDAGFGKGGTISQNISEFRELSIYYIFMVYLFDVAFLRSYAPAEQQAASAEDTAEAIKS